MPLAQQSLLEIVGMNLSGAPNLFYNDGPAKKFSVEVRWNGSKPVTCDKPVLQYATKTVGEAVQDQRILRALDTPAQRTLQPGAVTRFLYRIEEVSMRHNHKEFRLCFRVADGTGGTQQYEAITSGIKVQAKKRRSKKKTLDSNAAIAAATGTYSKRRRVDTASLSAQWQARLTGLEEENQKLRARIAVLESNCHQHQQQKQPQPPPSLPMPQLHKSISSINSIGDDLDLMMCTSKIGKISETGKTDKMAPLSASVLDELGAELDLLLGESTHSAVELDLLVDSLAQQESPHRRHHHRHRRQQQADSNDDADASKGPEHGGGQALPAPSNLSRSLSQMVTGSLPGTSLELDDLLPWEWQDPPTV